MEKTEKVKEPDNTLELLLSMDIQAPRTEKIKMKRLSTACGQDVIFTIKQLSYNRLAEIKKQSSDGGFDLLIVLAGTVSPKFKDQKLLDKYNAPTPAELLKDMLLPGEIANLSEEILHLCGYGKNNTIEIVDEVKKK
jgi:hypothetical protein